MPALPSLNPFARSTTPASSSSPRPEGSDPHRVLSDLINHSVQQHNGRWSNTIRAAIVRQLWHTVWQHRDWPSYFIPEDQRRPSLKSLNDWLTLETDDPDGLCKPWSMKEAQDEVERRRKEKGLESTRKPRFGKICGKVLQRHDRTYNCKTCSMSPSVSLCVDCFNAGDHEGHEVLFGQSFAFATSCDCGDPSAWKPDHLGCSHHPPLPAGVTTDPFPPKFEVPDVLILALQKTIAIVLEFIIHTVEHSHLPSDYGVLPKTEEEMRTSLGPTGEPQDKRDKGPWAVVMWQDERHVMHELARQVRDGMGVPWETAEQWVREAYQTGRKTLIVSNNPIIAFHSANMLQQIDAPVSLRLAADNYREEVAGTLISWLCDICQSTIGGDDRIGQRLVATALFEKRALPSGAPGTPLPADLADLAAGKIMGSVTEVKRMDWMLQLDSRLWRKAKWEMRQIYCSVFLSDAEVRKALACRLAVNYPRLAEYFLFQDKEFDANIIFSAAYLIFTDGAATARATKQAGLFTQVIQVAHAWYTGQVVNNGGVERLVIPPLQFDSNDTSSKGRLDLDVPAFSSKKGLAIIGHLRSMFRHPEMRKMIVKQNQLFNRALAFINMFVGIQPQRRERGSHIEYEVEWLKSFIVLGDLARLCRDLGEVYQAAPVEVLLYNMSLVANRILCDMLLISNTLDSSRYTRTVEHVVEDVLTGGSKVTVVKENVAHTNAFSFHHYTTLLFAEMLRSLRGVIPDGMDMGEALEKSVFRTVDPRDVTRMKLMLMEWPLQKHVVSAQIRANMWKKNGSALRLQYHHYCDTGIRECTVDQEFFILQLGLCIIDPLTFMVAVIDRFDLNMWFKGNVADPELWLDPDMDPKQRINLIEEFLLLVIHLVSYPAIINGWSREKLTRALMIHILAVQPMSFSEIFKRLSDKSQELSCHPILLEVANFRPATETAPGQYSLKDELYDEVDPYWRYYTRNDHRAVTDKLIARAKKADPSVAEPAVLPRQLELPAPSRPFGNIANFLGTHVVSDLVHWALAHCMHIANPDGWAATCREASMAIGDVTSETPVVPSWDFVLDYTLHLTMMALAVAPEEFARSSVLLMGQEGSNSTFQNLWVMQADPAFKAFRPRVDHVLKVIVASLPHHFTTDYRAHQEAEKLLALSSPAKPDPKAAAAARQKAIMAKFAKQQQDFAAMMEEVGDDDEDLEEVRMEEEISHGRCIVCQEEVTGKHPGGMLALLQPSRQLRDAVVSRDWFEESLVAPTSMDRPVRYARLSHDPEHPEPATTEGYPAASLRFGIHMSACGHYMHDTCMNSHFDATKVRHTQQVQRHHPENAVRLEYMCPLCKSLGNVLIPVEPSATPRKPPVSVKKDGEALPSLSMTIRRVSSEGLLRVADSQRIWEHHVETGEVVPWFSDCVFSLHSLDHQHRRGSMRSTSKMADRMRELVRPLSEQSQKIRGKKTHMYLPDDMVAYTVSMAEITQRGMSTGQQEGVLTVAEQINETSMKLIGKLIGLLQLELDLYFGPSFDRTSLRVGIFARFLPDWYRSSTLPSPLLIRQPLGMVIETAAIAPDLLQSVIIMAYYAELTRCMLAMSIYCKRCLATKTQPTPRTSPPMDPTLKDALAIFEGFRPVMGSILRHAGPFANTDGVIGALSEKMLAKLLYSHTLPFLRRCAIVYYSVTGTYPVTQPSALAGFNDSTSEYTRLLTILGIPHPTVTLANPASTETPIVARWITQWAVHGRTMPTLEYPGTYELVRMPQRWEDFVLVYTDKKCKKCGTKPMYPAICLFCGTMVCLAGDCCSEGEQGECNLHMRECGAVVGMFADIRRRNILYLYAGSGSFGPMPYLDVHGELDLPMRRGHRQYLHVGRLDELRRATWLMHGIPHLTARKLELTLDHGGWGCL
ncbi:hypothetical protein IAT38_004006 [Cryptococcus sp. DSM 104549]